MPNYCDYEMKVVGKTNCIKEFIKVMQADYNYGTNEFTGPRHMYRVFEAYVDQEPEAIDEYGNAECIISGYCAWSVASCMLDQDCSPCATTIEPALWSPRAATFEPLCCNY